MISVDKLVHLIIWSKSDDPHGAYKVRRIAYGGHTRFTSISLNVFCYPDRLTHNEGTGALKQGSG